MRTVRIADRKVAVTEEKLTVEDKLTVVSSEICYFALHPTLNDRRVVGAGDADVDQLRRRAIRRRHRKLVVRDLARRKRLRRLVVKRVAPHAAVGIECERAICSDDARRRDRQQTDLAAVDLTTL